MTGPRAATRSRTGAVLVVAIFTAENFEYNVLHQRPHREIVFANEVQTLVERLMAHSDGSNLSDESDDSNDASQHAIRTASVLFGSFRLGIPYLVFVFSASSTL
ncbi:hypothetical protein EVAR_16033_1 [Eumeta japonica]|uniref:Uncharacterized protein n=1 Tax=Eumeta variegata TaxID=151549 RepID=A0A4C1VYY6_EUMVA|nr:hypothetical protein EVAR_16033_1 [Eumeta japonica]